jgi:hypothetical protein
LWPACPNRGQPQDAELVGDERAFEFLELADTDRPVGYASVDPVPVAERAGELAQASHAFGEHDRWFLGNRRAARANSRARSRSA